VVFKGGNVGTAEDFVRFLVAEGWLGHYLDFAGDLFLPTMPASSASRSGSTRAIRTAWPRSCRPRRAR
jgi:hypothetical protein